MGTDQKQGGSATSGPCRHCDTTASRWDVQTGEGPVEVVYCPRCDTKQDGTR